ncbi:porin [Blattabacterium cuenoti]|uniref:porin n=1 Tax=Blattabacterium cuenoti TaxID=1653831 RepID=UPI00163BD8BE|nr:porin [Blattabacterium cuenoti]
MKKIKIIFLILFLGFFCPFHSYAEIIKEKETTNENSHFNIFLDFSNNINSIVKKEFSEGSHFSEDYLNLEGIGKVNDKISYRFAKQFKKIENSEILDLAYLKYKWNDQLYLLFGKQPFSFGSMEYANSLYEHVYRYSHVHKNRNNSIGLSFIYLPIKDHELQFQILNGMKNNKENMVQMVQNVNHPMGYSVNWNWSLSNHNKSIQNRWSYSIFQENENKKFWKLLALGSKLNCNPFTIEADYIFSDEDIEKNGNITKILRSCNNDYKHTASVKYETYLVKLKYNFIPKWNLIAKGVYEIGTSKKGINDVLGENKLFKKAYSYYGGIEFLPIIKSDDLSFHLVYQNQIINYILDTIKKENQNNHFLVLGLSYRIKMI